MATLIKEKIFELICEKMGDVSFVELEDSIENFKGDFMLNLDDFPRIILWSGLSKDAVVSLKELMIEEKIFAEPCSLLVYLIDGKCMDLPIAKRLFNYSKDRWLPIVFDLKPRRRKLKK